MGRPLHALHATVEDTPSFFHHNQQIIGPGLTESSAQEGKHDTIDTQQCHNVIDFTTKCGEFVFSFFLIRTSRLQFERLVSPSSNLCIWSCDVLWPQIMTVVNSDWQDFVCDFDLFLVSAAGQLHSLCTELCSDHGCLLGPRVRSAVPTPRGISSCYSESEGLTSVVYYFHRNFGHDQQRGHSLRTPLRG